MANTWIVVADSAMARIFTYTEDGTGLEPVEELQHPASRAHERDLATDRPGRTFDSEGPGRHAKSESVSPKEHEELKFSRELAQYIEKARTRNRFDGLVLVAAPSFLGELRKAMSDPALRLVQSELDKNLAHMDGNAVYSHLQQTISP